MNEKICPIFLAMRMISNSSTAISNKCIGKQCAWYDKCYNDSDEQCR